VVDLREPQEIRPGEWEFFEAAGSRVTHARWSQWATSAPSWDPDCTYVLVCAHGIRSQAALATVPEGIRASGLADGISSIGALLSG